MYGHVPVCKHACAYTSECLYECLRVVMCAWERVHVLVCSVSVTTHVGFQFMCDAMSVPRSG